MQAAPRPGGRSASWARRFGADAVGWLRSDLVDVVAVLPGSPARSGLRATESGARSRSPRGEADLEEALARWSRRFARERLFVLAARGLAFALSLGAVIAAAIAVSGSRLTFAVALYLVVPPLIGLAVVLASSWRDPGRPEVARVLDRDLALDERLGTAVEISGAGLPADGLEALVLAEANAALVTSHLSGARPTHRSARREWLVIVGALVIVSGLLVLIAGRGESFGLRRLAAVTSARQPTGRGSVAHGGGAKHAHLTTGRTRDIGPAARLATPSSKKPSRRNSALSVVTPPRSSTAGGRLSQGRGGDQRVPPGAFGKSGAQTAGPGAKAGTRGAGGGAGSRAGRGSGAEASTHSAASSRGGRAEPGRSAAGRSHTTNPRRVGTSRAGTSELNRTSSRAGGSAQAPASGSGQTHAAGHPSVRSAGSAAHTGSSSSAHGHASVGSGAGAGAGDNAVGRPQEKGLPRGFARLPIQAGYTPARNKSGPKTGDPAGRSGGKGPARSATEHAGGAAAAVTLPYIPPSAETGSADNALLRHYFSSAATVAGPW